MTLFFFLIVQRLSYRTDEKTDEHFLLSGPKGGKLNFFFYLILTDDKQLFNLRKNSTNFTIQNINCSQTQFLGSVHKGK